MLPALKHPPLQDWHVDAPHRAEDLHDLRLESGETIRQFLELYPDVSQEQVLAVLDLANSQVLECASSLMNA